MDFEQLTQIGTFLSGLGTLLVAVVATGVVFLDVRLRRRQLRESLVRDAAALDVHVEIELFPYGLDHGADSPAAVLETRIQVKNNGQEAWSIPAVYAATRALVNRKDSVNAESRFLQSDVEELPTCGKLSEPRNLARLDQSVYQVAPNETERFVRWDILGTEFIREYAVVAVHVCVVCARADLIGTGYSHTEKPGRFKDRWLDFMNGDKRKDTSRHQKIIFSRANCNWPTHGIKVGDRVLLLPDKDEPDLDKSRDFKEVLASALRWDRHKTVVLDPLTSKARANTHEGVEAKDVA